MGLYDTDKSQADAVKYVKGSIVNNGGTVHETACAAEYFTDFTYNYSGYERAYSYAMFKGEIMNGTVPIAGAAAYDENGNRKGHATPVHTIMMPENSGESVSIGYYDPADDKSHYMTFTEFCDGSRNGRIYDHTIIVD